MLFSLDSYFFSESIARVARVSAALEVGMVSSYDIQLESVVQLC